MHQGQVAVGPNLESLRPLPKFIIFSTPTHESFVKAADAFIFLAGDGDAAATSAFCMMVSGAHAVRAAVLARTPEAMGFVQKKNKTLEIHRFVTLPNVLEDASGIVDWNQHVVVVENQTAPRAWRTPTLKAQARQ